MTIYFLSILVYLSPIWYFVPRKIWQPWGRPGKVVKKIIHAKSHFGDTSLDNKKKQTKRKGQVPGRPDEFVKKIAQNVAQANFL
jgi:hypothetical protein